MCVRAQGAAHSGGASLSTDPGITHENKQIVDRFAAAGMRAKAIHSRLIIAAGGDANQIQKLPSLEQVQSRLRAIKRSKHTGWRLDTVNDMVNALNNVVSDAAEWAAFCDENDASKMALIGTEHFEDGEVCVQGKSKTGEVFSCFSVPMKP